MSAPSDNESWIIETGDVVILKKASSGIDGLLPIERLTYCLWVADYGMRNAGSIETAFDLYPNFQHEAVALANQLSLAFTHESFSLTFEELQELYFQRFDRICNELQRAYSCPSPPSA